MERAVQKVVGPHAWFTRDGEAAEGSRNDRQIEIVVHLLIDRGHESTAIVSADVVDGSAGREIGQQVAGN